MGRFRVLFLAVLFCFVCLFGCGAEKPTQTDALADTPVNEIQPAVDEESSADNSEMLRQLPWDVTERDFIPYDEYFSEIREYEAEVIVNRSGTGDEYYPVYENGILSLCRGFRREKVWDILEIDSYRWVVSDEEWIYGIHDERELFRVDYFGETRETVVVLENESFADTSFWLCDWCTLFFMTKGDAVYTIYRLYIPENRLDVMYADIPNDAAGVFFCAPISNVEVSWNTNDPEFFELYDALVQDTNSEYDPETMGREECIGLIEREYGMASAIRYYYNWADGDYAEQPFCLVTDLRFRSQEDVDKNGEKWWLDG